VHSPYELALKVIPDVVDTDPGEFPAQPRLCR
jgi:hypothetical protein